jgi:outer membrane receptor protein involved in Fe transport
MKKLLPLLFFIIGIFGTSNAQTISGVLLDKQTGEPLIGATVVVKGTTNGAQADIDGKFELKVTEQLPLVLVFSYVGYESQEIEIKTAQDLKRSFNLRLGVSETVLNAVEIVDSRITEKQQQSPLTVESMGLQAIKQTAAATFYEGLSTLKGVDMTAASLGFVVINTRGFNSTSPVRSLQLLDGADNQAPGLNFSVGNFAGATEIDIQKVDLIVGASSSLYGPNAFNGVINMQTKNPFYYPGLTVFLKGGERNLFEGAIRYAKVFKNKFGTDKFAFKMNFSYLRADDWVADNMSASTGSWQPVGNPGGYDAVNRYGDELLTKDAYNYANSPFIMRQRPGLGQFFRTGYLEKDVVNYNVRNIKANAALHYKITEKIELKGTYNFGTGSTVYQGDNRYRLNGLTFQQAKLEISQPDKFFVRAYATFENSGNSYDAVFTSLKMQQYAKTDLQWGQHYERFWNNGAVGLVAPIVRVKNLPGFPSTNAVWNDSIASVATAILEQYQDSLTLWHQWARNYADTVTLFGGRARLVPGTALYDSVFNDIISRTSFEQGGTLFYDRSKLVHVQGEYKFEPKKKGAEKPVLDIITGASFRMYLPDSKGTIFSDTIVRNYARDSSGNILKDNTGNYIVLDSTRRWIRNWEVGGYISLSKKFEFGAEKKNAFILTATCRVDKNQNFPVIATPAASIVYSYKNDHTVRLSFASAIRNPTLQDQYLYYNVGRAILIGNLNGFDSLPTVESVRTYFDSAEPNDSMIKYINVPKVRPERVQSLEIGYKGVVAKKLYIDGSAYVSFYRYFLGYQIGVTLQQIGFTKQPKQVYRVAANSPDRVMTYGVSVGFNYFFIRNYSLNGNYSWNRIDLMGSTDPIIPAYNTPEHKFNVGISGSNIKIKNTTGFGFNVTYKWIQGFEFQGSPQFTGSIPTYSLLDAQVSWETKKLHTTFKLGGSNLISNRNYQAYGGPGIGRMIYGSVLIDIDPETLKKGYDKVKTKW